MSLTGSHNVTRRARRSDETFHRDKRRKDVDRLAILESRTAPRRRRSAFEAVLGTIARLLGRG